MEKGEAMGKGDRQMSEQSREEFLKEVMEVVCQDRDTQYGNPEDSFNIIARYWSIYLGKQISPKDVSALMILLKIARIQQNTEHKDSWLDVAGYATCAAPYLDKSDYYKA